MPAPFKVEVVLPIHAKLGEGALWHAEGQKLYWIDIMSARVYQYDPATGINKGWDTGTQVGTVVVKHNSPNLLLALENGFVELNTATGELTPLKNGDPEANLNKINRFNDGKCDPAGRFWAGTISHSREPTANLWCLYPDGHIEKKLDSITNSNGIVWNSKADTMYYINTPTHQVWAFDYDLATGNIANKRIAVEVDGHPDGMAIDSEDKIWVAIWGGSRVIRFDPQTGQVLLEIPIPGAKNITSCAFGGKDLDELYITTAGGSGEGTHWDLEKHPEDPNAGNLFKVKLPYKGVKSVGYKE